MQVYFFSKGAACLVAKISGELDHHAAERIRKLIFDFSDLSFMDSSGIGVVIGRYKLMKSCGGSVAIVTENDVFERYGRIEELEPYLDERFYHCLKTVIINFQQVSMMRDQTIFFRNSEKIFLGRQNYIKARQTFAIYIKNPCNCNGFVV